MTAFTPTQPGQAWNVQERAQPVQLFLAEQHGALGSFVGAMASGHPTAVFTVEVGSPIDPAIVQGALAAVVEVSVDNSASIARFAALAANAATPLIAAAYNPPLALVRQLVRAGAHDVLPLPLDMADLETSLQVLSSRASAQTKPNAITGKVVSIVKSGGGAGATALLGQLAIQSAQRQAAFGREVCLIDLEVQFGDAAFQMGLQPNLSVAELIESGSRMDGALLRSVAAEHSSGLKVIASPPSVLPLETIPSDQILDIVEHATAEFGLVYIDLPSNWTNWSLSILARSDVVLLATEMSVSSLHRARRQIDLMHSQGLTDLDIRIVVNRYEKSLFRSLGPADVRRALGREISYTVSNDPQLVRAAIDRGVALSEVKKRSAVGKDIATITDGLEQSLGMER